MKRLMTITVCLMSLQALSNHNQWRLLQHHGFNVDVIEVDKYGRVWTASDGGLNMFDGHTWHNYNVSNSGIPSGAINAIYPEHKGRIWLGTAYNGLILYDGDTTWTVFDESNSDLPKDEINDLGMDSYGNLWIGTDGGGIAKFNGTTWTIYDASNSLFSSDYAKAIFVDNDNNVWAGMGGFDGGLAQFNGSGWFEYNTGNSGIPSDDVLSLYVDFSGVVWVGTWNGVGKMQGNSWTTYNSSNSVIPDDYIASIHGGLDGTIWVGSDQGLTTINGSTLTLYEYGTSDLPGNGVYGIAQHDGVMWLACTWGGVAKVDNGNWTVYGEQNAYLVDDYVNYVGLDNQDNAWAGTYYDGLAKFDGGLWEVFDEQNSDLPDETVKNIIFDQNNEPWIGTWLGGLAHFDGNATWTIYNTFNSDLTSNDIGKNMVFEGNILWVAFSTELLEFDGANWTTHTPTVSFSSVRDIEIDGNGTKWMATPSGLVKFDGTTWNKYDTGNSDLPNNFLHDLGIDGSNNIWMGTDGGGLAKFDGNTTWTIYDEANSDIPYDHVRVVSVGPGDKIWTGFNNFGASVFDGATWTSYNSFNSPLHFGIIDGINFDNNGWVWFNSTDDGIAVFSEQGFAHTPLDSSGITSLPPVTRITSPVLDLGNSPNPVKDHTTIRYEVPANSHVSLSIFDLTGKELTRLVNAYQPRGIHTIRYSPDEGMNGMYLYRLSVSGQMVTRKMIIAR